MNNTYLDETEINKLFSKDINNINSNYKIIKKEVNMHQNYIVEMPSYIKNVNSFINEMKEE